MPVGARAVRVSMRAGGLTGGTRTGQSRVERLVPLRLEPCAMQLAGAIFGIDVKRCADEFLQSENDDRLSRHDWLEMIVPLD